jgi:hypothetical protein
MPCVQHSSARAGVFRRRPSRIRVYDSSLPTGSASSHSRSSSVSFRSGSTCPRRSESVSPLRSCACAFASWARSALALCPAIRSAARTRTFLRRRRLSILMTSSTLFIRCSRREYYIVVRRFPYRHPRHPQSGRLRRGAPSSLQYPFRSHVFRQPARSTE